MKQPSIKKNFIMNIILTMSSFFFPLITFPYVSRVLLPVGTGRVAFAIALISYFNVFAQLGIPTYGVRACAQVRDSREELTRTAQELVIINLIMSGISYFCLVVALWCVPQLHDDRGLYILVSVTILLNSLGMEWLYKALEKYTYIAVRSILFKVVALIAMFLFIHKQEDYIIYGGISVFAASASNVVNLIHSRTFIDWKKTGKYNLVRHLKPVGIFFAMACATTIYTHLDELMLGFMVGDIAVGYYDAATKIKNVLVSVVTSLGVVILPRASYYIEKGMRIEFWDVSRKALHFILLMAGPLLVYFGTFAREIVYVLAGNAYEGAILPLQVLMPTLLFIGLTNIMGIQVMVPLGREGAVLRSVVLGAVVDAVLNLLLIPKLGATGAAIGTLTAEIVVFVYQTIALKEQIISAYRGIRYWKIVLAVMSGGIATVWVKNLEFNTFIIVVLGAIIFFTVYAAVLLVTKEDMAREIAYTVSLKVKKKRKEISGV